MVNGRLTRVVREVRDRSGGIINECEALIQGAIGAHVPGGVSGDGAPSGGGSPLALALVGSRLARLLTWLVFL